MKKLLMSAAMAALFGAMVPLAQAATTTAGVDVSVNLNSKCTVTNSSNPTLNFGTYDSLTTTTQTGVAASAAIAISCTRSLAAPTLASGWDGDSTGYGVIAGLNYKLNVGAVTTVSAGTAATATAGGVGTAATYTVAVTGDMAGLQAGTCAGVSCAGSATRTLTITY